MISVSDVELRAAARLLMDNVSFQVAAGDKIGLVGRNGAGKTTLLRVLAGEGQPAACLVNRSGSVGYLPQDTRVGDLDVLATDRILQARGLDEVLAGMRAAEIGMGDLDPVRRDAAVRRYGQLEERLTVLGGYAAEAEAAALASSLGLPAKVLKQPLHTLSGGQRRRVELARILFSGSKTMLLDEPTNHLDADSVNWLRDHLRTFRGGLIVISHDTDLLDAVVNKVFHLDADRTLIDIYNVGWKKYLEQRETDARRRRRERVNAERQAATLHAQADKMRAKATKAKAAQNMAKRADKLLAGVKCRPGGRPSGQAALPRARPLREGAADRRGAVEVVRLVRSVHRRGHGGGQGRADRRARLERRRQDHAAAAARRSRATRYR